MFSPHVLPGVGLVVCDYSWYATAWQAALTAGFRVPSCSRTNTELSELYLFLACTTPSIAYAQERSQWQSQRAQITKCNACNLLVFRLPSHLIIYAHPWAERNIEKVLLSPTSNNNHFVRVASQATSAIGLLSSPNCSDYVGERIYWRNLSVSCRVSFDAFVTSPMCGDIHRQDYFIFLGLQVLHRDLQPIFLKCTVGIWSIYW
jgi:hypothetical protein